MVLDAVEMFIKQVIDDEEDIKFLGDFINNYCFFNKPLGKIVVFYGDGNNGKTTFTNNIISLLGEDNCLKSDFDSIIDEESINEKKLLIVDDDKDINFDYLFEKIDKINVIVCTNSVSKIINTYMKKYLKVINFQKTFQTLKEDTNTDDIFNTDEPILQKLQDELYLLKRKKDLLKIKLEYIEGIQKEKNEITKIKKLLMS